MNWYYTVRTTLPLAVWETVLAVARVLGLGIKTADTAVEQFLVLVGVDVEPVPACARQAGVPMLYKRDDFARTDIETA